MRVLTKLVTAVALFGAVTVIHADSTPAGAKSVSSSDLDAQLKKSQAQIQDDYRAVLRLKEAARELKDVIKLGCVNDRLVQMKAQMNIADSQAQSAVGEIEKGAASPASYQDFKRTADGIHQLREEANACVGTPELVKQESGVEVQHPDIPDDPTVDNPFGSDTFVDVEPPGYASPFF